MSSYQLFWGEMHDNTHQAEDPDFSMTARLEAARKHLDFYCGAYYPSTSPAFKKGGHPSQDAERQPLNVETWKSPGQIGREWGEVKDVIRTLHEDHRFVIFPGYEWQGDGTWGDHNVFFNMDDPPLFRVDTLEELYRQLETVPALAIPHHTAYIKGFRGKDWNVHREDLSPFMEIFSIHGSSEGDLFGEGLRSNPFLGPDCLDSSLTAAIRRGLKIGIIGSTDNWGPLPGHYGRGLAAVWSRDLTRDSLWEAFRNRRLYGVTGDRISLNFESGGAPMGSILPARPEARHFQVQVGGLDEIDYIELLRDEEVLERFSPLFRPSQAADDQDREYLFRLEFGWGPAANVISLPPKEWSGAVNLDAGEIIDMVPCWISEDNRFSFAGKHARFDARTTQATVNEKVQNGYVIKVRGKGNRRVTVEINGETLQTTLAELCRSSRVLWNRKESAELIRKHFSVDPEALARKDVLFGMAYKAKVHRTLPEEAYSLTCSFIDDSAGGTPCSYRVRVLQKNGQRAWSSPIWFNDKKG